jgi:hypothetical protein
MRGKWVSTISGSSFQSPLATSGICRHTSLVAARDVGNLQPSVVVERQIGQADETDTADPALGGDHGDVRGAETIDVGVEFRDALLAVVVTGDDQHRDVC